MASPLELGIERLRLTSDPLRLNARLARGRWGYRLFHAGIFALLGSRVRPVLRQVRRRVGHPAPVLQAVPESP